MRAQFEIGERPQHNGFLLGQDARIQQLGQHAFDPVRMLGHIFQEQHTALHFGDVGRADQAAQHAQVAAPQRGVFSQQGFLRQVFQVRGGQTPTGPFPPALRHVFKTSHGDLIQMRRAKVAGGMRPGPADGLGFGQQAHLQGCEIAVPHPLAARLDGRGDGLVGEFFQQACQAIATPCRHDDVGATCGRAADGQQTRVVITGKTLI